MATIVAIGSWTVDELLFWKWLIDAFDHICTFDCSNYAKSPTRSTHLLILNPANPSLLLPINNYLILPSRLLLKIFLNYHISPPLNLQSQIHLPKFQFSQIRKYINLHLIRLLFPTIMPLYLNLISIINIPSIWLFPYMILLLIFWFI